MNSGRVIRLCLIGLPAGLVMFGLMSVLFTHLSGKTDTEEDDFAEKRSLAAGILRKDVNPGDLERYLKILTGDIGERNLASSYDDLRTAAYWLESTMGQSNMGYVVRKQKFEAGGREVWNVIAELPGASRPEEIVVIGAHYDSAAGSPGANDNGTGVAALLSLANAFSGTRNERSIRFVAFTNGTASASHYKERGSAFFAEAAQNDGDYLVGILCLDALGPFAAEPDSLAFIGAGKSGELAALAKVAFEKAGAVDPKFNLEISEGYPELSAVRGWDHQSFLDAGYKAVLATGDSLTRDPHRDLPTDTADRIDFGRFASVVRGLQGVVNAWANP